MKSYRDILSCEFKNRKSLNKLYTLRAFARDLNLSASQLSNVMANKKGLSLEKALVCAQKIGLRGNEKELFLLYVEKEHAKRKKVRLEAQKYLKTIAKYQNVCMSTFDIISEWYYFAILASLQISHEKKSSTWISKHLNLDLNTVEHALVVLKKLCLVKEVTGHYEAIDNNFKTETDFPSMALRNSHKQSLQQAMNSLDEYSVEQRDITSMTMAIDPKKIPEAKRRIAKFRKELCEFLESGEKKSVYNLNIQLHPLTSKEML
ncbi:MAG: DUF4423 domain-containing protein [Bacteriovoracaceae bacterium]|jgi:uncharacterized protein (TIGR02147 family)|nr:DUF4423 domain-containing protein [Bacteriovoracaceae bacterium]